VIKLNIQNETSRLRAVVLGTAISCGPTPKAEDAYDPKSLEHILAGTYPVEDEMIEEMEALDRVFHKYGVHVYRPAILEDCNQIFARDIAFVIEDKIFKSNILPDREEERIVLPDEYHMEGGDVMPWNDYIFIGTYTKEDYPAYITARTNRLLFSTNR